MKANNPVVVEQGGALPYMPQLDALRAGAVFLVFLSHWGERTGIPGTLGVRLFFVLSGFLITAILLRIRREMERDQTSWSKQLRLFYARRFLRLFPALLLLIAVLWIADWSSIRHTWAWHLSYLSNVYFALRGEYEGAISPLWSLSVEEQFYLLWPLLVLLAPRRFHRIAVFGLIGFAVLWRLMVALATDRGLWTYVLPFNWVDGLAFGALLALSEFPNAGVGSQKLRQLARNVGVPAFFLLLTLRLFHWLPLPASILFELAASAAFTWLVAGAAIGFSGRAGRVLEWPPLLYLGRISYGLYLYHAFIPNAFKGIMRALQIPLTNWDVPRPLYEFLTGVAGAYASKVTALVMMAVYLVLTVGVASISWWLLEKPINRLRRFVRYHRVAPGNAPLALSGVDSATL